MSESILFLCYGSPWPPHSGGALRTIGLLKQLSQRFSVELLVLTLQPLNLSQEEQLGKYSTRVRQIRQKTTDYIEKLQILWHMIRYRVTYHCAVIESSINACEGLRDEILRYQGVVFTDVGHWGVLVKNDKRSNWILNQCDADVQFWKAYAKQTNNFLVRTIALINWKLADRLFRRIYPNVGRIISVCHEDKELTRKIAPSAVIEVIENGVDCKSFFPDRENGDARSRLLFTGTSAARNVVALLRFVKEVMPLIQKKVPEVELLVGGNFSREAINQFCNYSNIRFTGRVEDMRPLFNESDVFVAPFRESHGSKLKISEAMAMGMPIVSYREGARGFQLTNGESVSIADTANDFADKVIELLIDSDKRNQMGANARAIAENTLDWDVLGERLFKVLTDARRIAKKKPMARMNG